ncbi:MAG: nucleotide sugar dehydrogenase [Actinomycetota bacterium]|nr:nucleotide sugar dehydrogenase [Actinomycetota bacterium]
MSVKVSVVGLGKMGLPLACQYASHGHDVTGCDVLVEQVDAVNRGECPVRGEEGLEGLVADMVAAGRLRATTDTPAAAAGSDVIVMIPPVKLNRDGTTDYATMDAASRSVGAGLRRGALVVYETTLPVGDTRQRFGPMLAESSGLRAGADFSLAFSPERVFMGRIFADLKSYPKIVGGIDAASTAAAAAFYRSVLDADVIEVANSETAEFVKLAETTYRDVNIALANEMARAGERLGVDALQAFELANTQPFSHIHSPGAGVGGHCIPVYPRLLMSRAPELRIPALSREINDEMPAVMVDLLDAELGGLAGRTVAVLGLSFRGDVKEATLSPAWPVLERLRAAGARVRLHDPWFTDDELAATGAEPAQGDPVADGTILLAKHAPFRELDYSRGGAIIDGRPGGWVPATAPGQRLHVIGRGWSAGG